MWSPTARHSSFFELSKARPLLQIDSGSSSSTCSTVPEGAFVHLDLARDLGDWRDDPVTIFTAPSLNPGVTSCAVLALLIRPGFKWVRYPEFRTIVQVSGWMCTHGPWCRVGCPGRRGQSLSTTAGDSWPVLPPTLAGDRRQPHAPRYREVLEAIAWRFRTGSPWRDLPEDLVTGSGRGRGNATAAGRSTAPTPRFSPPSGAHGIDNAQAVGVSFEGPETPPLAPKPVPSSVSN